MEWASVDQLLTVMAPFTFGQESKSSRSNTIPLIYISPSIQVLFYSFNISSFDSIKKR